MRCAQHGRGNQPVVQTASSLTVKTAGLGRASFFCRGSRVGCFDLDFAATRLPFGRTRPVANLPPQGDFAGDTPATTVMLDRSPQFLRGMASRPQLRQDQLESDCRERSSIFLRNFRRCAECDQRIQVAKGAETSARQTWRALNHQCT